VYYSSAKGTLGWGKIRRIKNKREKMVFLGYLIGVENWRDLGRAQVFSP